MATFYEPGRTYTQAELDALIQQLSQRPDLARLAVNDPGIQGRMVDPDQVRQADAIMRMYVDPVTGRLRDRYVDGPEGRMESGAQLGYYQQVLRDGGAFNIEGDGRDFVLAAQYNPDGTLRGIVPTERHNDSLWQTIRPVAAMAGLAAGGGWLANALQGAGAAGLAEGAYGAGVVPSGAALGAGGAAAGAAGAAGGLGTAAGTAAGATTLGSLLSNPAVVGGGLSLVGGAMGADAARDAARAQEASANAAIEEIRRQYDQNRQDQMPWMQAGQTSLADLMARMGDLTTPYTQADFQSDPGYQFELAEGQRALDAAARARGLYGSSGSLRELLRYSQGLASTRYQDAFNRDLTNRQNTYNMLSGISGTGQVTAGNLGSMGQGTANTVGDLLTQTGNAQAAGRVGAANAWTQAGSNALNAWQQQMLIDRIGSNLYR